MKRHYTLHLSEIIYDIELQIHEISNEYRVKDEHETASLLEKLRSEAKDQLLRSCGLACKHLYELLGHYAEAPENDYGNNALITETQPASDLLFSNYKERLEAQLDESRTFDYALNLPGNIRKSSLSALGEWMHRYAVSRALCDWFGQFGLSDLQKEYESRMAACAANLQISLSKRSRPCSMKTETTPNGLIYE